MANLDKNIVITPSVGSSTDNPKIQFTGANTDIATNIALNVYPSNKGTVSFEGSAGQLLSVTNSVDGVLYSVNDVSGIPSIELTDFGLLKLNPYSGNVAIGALGYDTTAKLQVSGAAQGVPTLGTASNSSLYITNTDTAYGTMFGVRPEGDGWVQVGRSDGTATPYNLLLNPAGGYVGVGTYSPTQTLHVVGDQKVEGTIYTTSLSVQNPIQAPAVTDSQYYRLRYYQTSPDDGYFGVNQGANYAYLRYRAAASRWQLTSDGTNYSNIIRESDLTDSVSTVSPTTAASATAVRTAYNTGVAAQVRADSGANTVQVSQNTGSILYNKKLNFNNSAAINVTVTAFSTDSANITFFANTSNPAALGPQGIQGIQGIQGTQGIQGVAINIIGSPGYISRILGSSSLGQSVLYDDGTNIGVGTAPTQKLDVAGGIKASGAIYPSAGSGTAGIIFPANPGGGSGDIASIKYYAEAGETTTLELNVQNDGDDRIKLNATGGTWVYGGLATQTGGTYSAEGFYLGLGSNYNIGLNKWAGAGSFVYPGFSFNGTDTRFGFSATSGVVDVYTDGRYYAGDSSLRVLNEGEAINSKRFDTDGSILAKSFKDYVSPGYYVTPSGTSVLNALTILSAGGNSVLNYPGYTYGFQSPGINANSYGYDPIMGFSYSNNAPFTGPFVSFAAQGYNLQLSAPYGAGNGFAFRTRNGDAGTWNSWYYPAIYNVNTNGGGALYATAFYDQSNANYYVDPASTSVLNSLYIDGAIASQYNESVYYRAAIEVRERSFGGAQDDTFATAPRIAFHWGGRVASQIAMDSSGVISILNNPGNDYGDFKAFDIAANGGLSVSYGGISNAGDYSGTFNTAFQVPVSQGFNNATAFGVAALYNLDGYNAAVPNGPTASWNQSLVHVGNATRGFQIASPYDDNVVYFRRGSSGWSSWWKFATSGTNFGTTGYLLSSSSMQSPIYYDYNNTNYYLNPAGWSELSGGRFNTDLYLSGQVYADGGGWFRSYGNVGLYNQTHGKHFYADGQYWNVTGDGTYTGIRFRTAYGDTQRGYIYSDTNGIGILSADAGWAVRCTNTETEIYDSTYINTLYSYIMYDRNDTSYYMDPNSADNVYGTRLRSGILMGPNTGWGAYLLVGGNGKAYGYGDNSIVASVAATDGNLHLDAASGKHTYINFYDGDTFRIHRGNSDGIYRVYVDADGIFLNDGWYRINGSRGFYWSDYGGGFQMYDTTWIRTYNGKQFYCDTVIQAGSAMYSPIYYDVNNTSYYLDPAGNSYLNGVGLASLSVSNYANIGTLTVVGDTYGVTSFKSECSYADPINRLSSGYYQQNSPLAGNGWPESAPGGWWHLHSTTHTNGSNYYAMQLAADFYSNKLYYRSTNGSGSTTWSRVALDNNTFGHGQTWTDVKASRAHATTYTNTTGRPIMISFTAGASITVTVTIAGTVVFSDMSWGHYSDPDDNPGFTIVVPTGATYSISCVATSYILRWFELR